MDLLKSNQNLRVIQIFHGEEGGEDKMTAQPENFEKVWHKTLLSDLEDSDRFKIALEKI